ncbi:putative sodium-dependent transporter [Alkalihalophilus pseudofirmus OF4]|uniref:Transporter n=1 Tax=Alkalihalophilus pseudofirmus (strain ATCC BAA-2126 / JCM 17055 / OF4) TaxID=398511 RepID=D3FRD3_ALKPO|nr:sodium-dependent transporter [Alkalihalophilus pseudofirmus]ADC51524.1 putative sodium-dependent transporter [Alkalihalophilus pseudofirmus OF4]
METQNEQWSSKLGFIYATAGTAIGLGAIWKFPYVAGTSGGGAFFLLFILFTLLIGLPLLIGEFILGRKTGKDAISTYKELAPKSAWVATGWIGVITCFIILTFYSVIGGWILIYLMNAITGQLSGLSVDQLGVEMGEIIANPWTTLGAQLVFILLTIIVVAKGIQQGIERASKVMMPALFVLLLIIAVRSLSLDGAMEGVQFLLLPDFSSITSETILFALGQALFALSLGISIMVTYSSYVPKTQSLPLAAGSIGIMNIFVALLAGLIIFPGVFTFGLEPSEGPQLIFVVLPAIFEQMMFGQLFLIAFLVLFLIAALTSAFSLLEIIVASRVKKEMSKRQKASWIMGIAAFVCGIPACLSFGVMADVEIFGLTFFDAADQLASNILMPLGALLISIFVPLKLSKTTLLNELKQGSSVASKLFMTWYFLLKYVTPFAIIVVFLDALGLFSLF